MNISLRDYLLSRNLDRLTHRQRAIQHGVVSVIAVPLLFLSLWLLDLVLGWEVRRETALGSAAGLLIGGAIYTVVSLIRGPQPSPEPDLHLTDEMSRRVR